MERKRLFDVALVAKALTLYLDLVRPVLDEEEDHPDYERLSSLEMPIADGLDPKIDWLSRIPVVPFGDGKYRPRYVQDGGTVMVVGMVLGTPHAGGTLELGRQVITWARATGKMLWAGNPETTEFDGMHRAEPDLALRPQYPGQAELAFNQKSRPRGIFEVEVGNRGPRALRKQGLLYFTRAPLTNSCDYVRLFLGIKYYVQSRSAVAILWCHPAPTAAVPVGPPEVVGAWDFGFNRAHHNTRQAFQAAAPPGTPLLPPVPPAAWIRCVPATPFCDDAEEVQPSVPPAIITIPADVICYEVYNRAGLPFLPPDPLVIDLAEILRELARVN